MKLVDEQEGNAGWKCRRGDQHKDGNSVTEILRVYNLAESYRLQGPYAQKQSLGVGVGDYEPDIFGEVADEDATCLG